MKLVYHGDMGLGHHARQRAEAFARLPGVEVHRSAIPRLRGFLRLNAASLLRRLGMSVDFGGENAALLAMVRNVQPDIVFVDNARGIRPKTLTEIASLGAKLVFSSPDDIVAPHNSSKWLVRSLPLWDLFFTTKTFNVEELRERGVHRPILVGNMYNPAIHRPLTSAEVGADFEAFDIVFVGTHEKEREDDLRALARTGMRVLVHGNTASRLSKGWRVLEDDGVTVRPAVIDDDYARAMHHGKIAMCFLRKMNRDQITQRSIEIPAMARPMLAEKTAEHDAHFVDGTEYAGFSTRDEMLAQATALLAEDGRRRELADAGRRRAQTSPYSIDDVVAVMHGHIAALLG
ncbi:MAG: glycosyltransferase [Sphingomonas sp.]|uniref:CgeB family protein n=1 Tax=Sphingomonas sp. TaxID=28214 RepID=UPI001AC48401|nr:glycosyltransferase [Sphingomonas sp.]MBN8806909.1 glycosyltransferase [Sphingomonas sp.]